VQALEAQAAQAAQAAKTAAAEHAQLSAALADSRAAVERAAQEKAALQGQARMRPPRCRAGAVLRASFGLRVLPRVGFDRVLLWSGWRARRRRCRARRAGAPRSAGPGLASHGVCTERHCFGVCQPQAPGALPMQFPPVISVLDDTHRLHRSLAGNCTETHVA